MKKVVKGTLICLVMTFVYMMINGVVFSVLPFSDWFKENSASQEVNMPLSFIYMLFIIATMYLIAVNAKCKGIMLYLAVIGSVFYTQDFMTQIETIVFGNAFSGLGISDVWMLVVAGFLCLIPTGIIIILLTKRKSQENEITKIDWKKFALFALLNGLIYMVIYFLFGYFVAWKSEELRIFYSGSPVDVGFIGQIKNNIDNSPILFLIQYVRGILFTIGIIPLMKISWKHKYDFLISVVLIFLCTGVSLIVPNFLFPDAVRIQHFYEMTSSMTLFGVVTAFLMQKCRKLQ